METLIGDEILDETDRYVDNERTQRVDSLELPERFRVRARPRAGPPPLSGPPPLDCSRSVLKARWLPALS